MNRIRGVYEVALPVRELARAEKFYREVLGLEVGLRDEGRNWLFLRAGRHGMVVLQENPDGWTRQHFALTVANDRPRLEAISEMSQQDADASEAHEAEEILRMARDETAVVL